MCVADLFSVIDKEFLWNVYNSVRMLKFWWIAEPARVSTLNKQGGCELCRRRPSSIIHFYPLSTERRVLVGWWIGNQSVLSIIKPLRRGPPGGPRPVMTFLPLPSNIYKTIRPVRLPRRRRNSGDGISWVWRMMNERRAAEDRIENSENN